MAEKPTSPFLMCRIHHQLSTQNILWLIANSFQSDKSPAANQHKPTPFWCPGSSWSAHPVLSLARPFSAFSSPTEACLWGSQPWITSLGLQHGTPDISLLLHPLIYNHMSYHDLVQYHWKLQSYSISATTTSLCILDSKMSFHGFDRDLRPFINDEREGFLAGGDGSAILKLSLEIDFHLAATTEFSKPSINLYTLGAGRKGQPSCTWTKRMSWMIKQTSKSINQKDMLQRLISTDGPIFWSPLSQLSFPDAPGQAQSARTFLVGGEFQGGISQQSTTGRS